MPHGCAQLLFQQRLILQFEFPDAKAPYDALLGVSGGLDSVCLLHYAVTHRELLNIRNLTVCHVHHGVRETAERDATFVRKLSEVYGVPFELRRLDGKALRDGGDFEEKARIERYRIFREIAKDKNCQYIFTAHHGDDQAETLYMRLKSGTSLKGLQGIQEDRGDGVFRPLLHLTKNDLHDYAEEHELDWCEDETNADTTYERNRTRHVTLPFLEQENSGTSAQLAHTANLAQRAYPKIIAAADALIAPCIVPPSLWPFPQECAPYRNVLALHGAYLEERLAGLSGNGEELLRLWLMERGFTLPFGKKILERFKFPRTECSGFFVENIRNILWFCGGEKVPSKDNLYLLPGYNGIQGIWRYRKDGDVYSPPGLSAPHRKLSKWFSDNGVPCFARDSIPVFARNSAVLRIFTDNIA